MVRTIKLAIHFAGRCNMSPFAFKRTHIPTGRTEIRTFDVDYCLFADKKVYLITINIK